MNYELNHLKCLAECLTLKKMADDYNNNVIININDNAAADSLSTYPHFGYSAFLNVL